MSGKATGKSSVSDLVHPINASGEWGLVNPPKHGQEKMLVSGLVDLYQAKQLVDVTLVAEERKVACHRVVLAASSRYFRAMFTSDMVEQSESEVELHGMEAESVQALVSYMYTAKVEINNRNAESLFTAASLFDMLDVCELCALHMLKELHVSNCVGIYQFACFHECQTLKQASLDYIVDHFWDVSDSEEFQSLGFEEFSNIIRNGNLNISHEERVYESVERWIRHDMESRKRHFGELFKLVRLPLITEEYISSTIHPSELVKDNTYVQGILSMWNIYLAAKDMGEEETALELEESGLSSTPRLGMFNRKMMVFVGGSQDKHNRGLTAFHPPSKKNYYAIPMHVSFDFKYRIDHHRAVVTDTNQIYLVGGIFYEEHHFETSGTALQDLKMFEPYTCRWLSRAPMTYPRCAHVALHNQGKIYALGGKSTYPEGMPLSSCESYDIETDEWSPIPDLPCPLFHHGGIGYNNKLIVMGGVTNDEEVVNHFLQFDVETRDWTFLKPTMKTPRAEFGITLVDDKIFVIGGTNGNIKLCSMEVFNMGTQRWFFGPDFPEDRKSMVTVTYDDCIYVCGGVRTLISRMNRAPRVVEARDLWKYDPGTGFWSRQAKLVQYANVYACVVAELNTKRLHQSEFISSG